MNKVIKISGNVPSCWFCLDNATYRIIIEIEGITILYESRLDICEKHLKELKELLKDD